MSADRDALESAQARLKELEAQPVADLSVLAESLEREADTYEQLLEKGERRALARENTRASDRLITFGFALLFGTPSVAMIGISISKFLRHQPEAAVGILILGVVLIFMTLMARARRAIAHLVSAEWRLVARARRAAAALRCLG